MSKKKKKSINQLYYQFIHCMKSLIKKNQFKS